MAMQDYVPKCPSREKNKMSLNQILVVHLAEMVAGRPAWVCGMQIKQQRPIQGFRFCNDSGPADPLCISLCCQLERISCLPGFDPPIDRRRRHLQHCGRARD